MRISRGPAVWGGGVGGENVCRITVCGYCIVSLVNLGEIFEIADDF